MELNLQENEREAHLWTRGSVISTLVGEDLSKNTNQELGFSTSSRVPVEATKQKKRKRKNPFLSRLFFGFVLNNENQEVVDSRWL